MSVIEYHARVKLGRGTAIHRVISNVKAGRVVVQAERSGRIEGVPVERVRVIATGCACMYCDPNWKPTNHTNGSQ